MATKKPKQTGGAAPTSQATGLGASIGTKISGRSAALPDGAAPAAFDAKNLGLGVASLAQPDDVTVAPWRSIVRLAIVYQSGDRRQGTAWFIGPTTLATAAHNIHDLENGFGQFASIQVVPPFTDPASGVAPCQVSGFECDPRWLAGTNDPALDYGVIRIADPALGQRLGWLDFAALSKSKLQSIVVDIGGYPTGPMFDKTQNFSGGAIKRVKDKLLYYDFQTEEGMSGAPIFATDAGQTTVVGIHTSGGDNDNRGRQIDSGLETWLRQFAAS